MTTTSAAPAAPARTAPRRRRSLRDRPNPLAGLGALAWLLVVGVPLYALLVATFQQTEEYRTAGPLTVPADPTLDNYVGAFGSGLITFVWNTMLVTAGVVAIVVVLSVMAGYAIVRSRTWLTNGFFRVFLLGLAIPSQAVIIPVYLIIVQLDFYDSLLAVVLPTAAFALPVCVLILTGSMRDISDELYEAMALDGAGAGRTFLRLVVPLSRSGISTIAVYAALQAWNGFLFPLILTQSAGTRVITLGLYEFQGQYRVDIPGLLTAVVLATVPLFLVYLVARRSLISGLMGVGGK
ncbi:carbohydrate ABC transporter permease [Streptomonospora nanhaiensis]|uniref:Xylobiose transport system permease protein n=1 Tax=Streptomonospora nanhaiensis TaxID=1323731 RepID=A0A853BFP8_9ACTN|nr:carbohydrate ABC transporter permease [Streptomonospora nanhaiensis]MBX9387532.1 carbohydrate ABC transporter permease [Streptomonospora nanhaiensis]NYI94129.1 xylobiose transport system permease protein [Streptomonospora nanhaiensis]